MKSTHRTFKTFSSTLSAVIDLPNELENQSATAQASREATMSANSVRCPSCCASQNSSATNAAATPKKDLWDRTTNVSKSAQL
eukprot:CAMPEP_0203923178 /NCGR_PEP_ID=MMETSP0359-20131031/63122_1 /ASSEMBLY_ACC=CAM_ASM_000338 /TAXON_ID=268821 /ORGANISM="Scrippsiella Hangoei, Strain SHTV-5" /LENGTH=82 /DNA_ID=CAMNT_0050851215 /DNA_START=293 /DNA_END=541 /DNA_ORIENTATION=-